MADLDDDAVIEFTTQGLAIGVGEESINLGLQSDVLSAELEDTAIKAQLISDNLLLRLYQPGGVPTPDDPFFDEPIPGSGALTPAQQDAIEKAAIDAAIAQALLLIQRSADDIATSVLANASAVLANALEAKVSEISAAFQSDYLSIAFYERDVTARVDDKAAAIQEKLETYVDEDSALAQRVDTVAAGTQQALAAIQETRTAYADADTAISQRVDGLVSDVADNRAAITTVDDARADDYQATANRLDTLESKVGVDVDAKIQTISNTVATNYSATATQIQTVTTTLNGHTATINTQQQSINGVSARWGVQLDVNGWVVGFQQNNNGAGSGSFVITAPNFVVAYPGYDAIAPFQVSFNNGRAQVSMDAAYIRDASIGTAKIADLTVTNAKIANLSVTNAKIADASITNAKIGDAEITTAKIGYAQIDTARIGANAVTTMATIAGTTDVSMGYYASGGACMIVCTGGGSMQIQIDGVTVASSATPGPGSLGTPVWTGNISAGPHTIRFFCTVAIVVTMTVFEAKR